MDREEIKLKLIELDYPSANDISRRVQYRDLKYNIINETNFLDQYFTKVTFLIRVHCIYNDIFDIPKCQNINCHSKVGYKPLKKKDSDVSPYGGIRFNNYCSASCSSSDSSVLNKKKETNRRKYGVEHHLQLDSIKDKQKSTNLERYGVDNLQRSNYFKEKSKETNRRKYGVEHHLQLDSIKDKQKSTNLERYGVSNVSKMESTKEKVKQTNIELYGNACYLKSNDFKKKLLNTSLNNYGVEHPSSSPIVREKVKETNFNRYGSYYTQSHISKDNLEKLNNKVYLESLYNKYNGGTKKLSKELGIDVSTVNRYINYFGIERLHTFSSQLESEVADFIESLGFTCERGNRLIISPFELDIVVPEYKLAIEFNGIYWHSELYKEQSYHQKKSLKCHEKGYELIHIWEDQWLDETKQEIIKNKIRSKLGFSERVYARKTSISEVTSKDARTFYDNNHIQGFVGASVHYGLYNIDELVACLSLQNHENGEWELVRYATSKSVVGGFSKLLKHFTSNNEWNMIYTFAHLDYSKGELYEKNGFEMKHITQPGMWYIKGCERYSRQKFMKHKLKDRLETFDPNLTEVQNMHNNEYLRLFDSGSIRYEMYNN